MAKEYDNNNSGVLFKNDRKDFESKWDDVKLFINYGMLTEEDFYSKMEKIALMKDTDGKYFTFEEYKTLIESAQTDKDKNLIYLYATDRESQYGYIESAKSKGYSVLLMDNSLDVAVIGMLEQKFGQNSRFMRVDSDTIDRLIVKDDAKADRLPDTSMRMITKVFSSQLPKIEKADFHVDAQPLGENALPVMITCSEYMRRMKDMAAIQSGMSFYGDMPDMYNVVLNTDHKLIKTVLADAESSCSEQVRPIQTELDALKELKAQDNKDEKETIESQISEKESAIDGIYSDFSKDNKIVHELIDLALLQNGMLKGEALSRFIRRSVELI